MSYHIEQFNFSVTEYSAELNYQTQQTLTWLNRNGYLDGDTTEQLLKRVVVVPIKNEPKFGERLLRRFFGKEAEENAFVFPITLLDDITPSNSPEEDKPQLKLIKK